MFERATYSPDDNKLRLYPTERLPRDLYERVRAVGFIWAPKQELFVAPAWTPEREDLAIELAGAVGDEDTTLADRAEDRAERFEGYSERRAADALRAKDSVDALADAIPFGQPILVGHHSERHARRDAEKIESGMRRAVKLWDTSTYWTDRARGAVQHAKYKELPAVRARRIKGIESDRRKMQQRIATAQRGIAAWSAVDSLDSARIVANHWRMTVIRSDGQSSSFSAWDVLRPDGERYAACPSWPFEQVKAHALERIPVAIEHAQRWIAHYDNRLAYERAMLDESGGTVADRTKPEVGGAVQCWASPRGGWSLIKKVNRVTVSLLDNWGNGGRDFKRNIEFDKLGSVMSKAEVDAARAAGRLVDETARGFYLISPSDQQPIEPVPADPDPIKPSADFDAMRSSLRAGVRVITAPQLFPTPATLAARVVELANVRPGHSVLEPSAGTGALLNALPTIRPGGFVVAVEINHQLAEMLRPIADSVRCSDFLTLGDDLGTFDRIVMNPPFEAASDIRHVLHALKFLKPGGRLVSIVAAGPRQREKLAPLGQWIDLPDDSFAVAGTNVRTAVIVIDA